MIFSVMVVLVMTNAGQINAQLEGDAVMFREGGDNCRTPVGKAGTCIKISRCRELVDVLRQTGHPTNEDLDRLRRANCGYDRLEAKVCCSSEVTFDTLSTTPLIPSQTPQSPPDVTAHPNLRLLDHNVCGPVTEQRIIGGNKTGVFDYPWMALIAYKINNKQIEFRCGGSVINNRYILTAAHCVTQLPSALTLIGVRVGEHDLRTERDCNKDLDGLETDCAERYQDFGIEEVHFYSGFTKSVLQDDIGLIRVDSSIDFRPINARPICLPIGDAATHHQKKVIVTGWGATENGPRSQDLLQVKLALVSNEECAKAYKKNIVIWYKQLCAGGTDHKDSCLGDSGGPLQAPSIYNKTNVRFVQYGIVSFGTKNCGIEGYPGVYTRLAYYTDWILDRTLRLPWHAKNFQLKMIFSVIVVLVMINAVKVTTDHNEGAVIFPDGDDCRTPNGKSGTCINVKRCHMLIRSLNLPGHPTKEDVDLLRKSRCGLEGPQGREFKVCCPSWTSVENRPKSSLVATPIMPVITEATIAPSHPDTHDLPPDVTTHPNLRLLDQDICGPVTEEKIIGGNKTGVFDYPWMALIAYKVYNNYIEFRCGGSVINNRYILTAAHCVTQFSAAVTLIGVRVGEYDQRTERDCNKGPDGVQTDCAEYYQEFGIEEIHFHSAYTKSVSQNDIGLIRVDSPIDFGPINARPICLPIGDAATHHQTKFIVTGWGETETGSGSPDLLQGKLTLVSNEQCAKAYKKNTKIWHKQLCAQGHQFSCFGDSGGPLQAPAIYNKISVKFVQYGIVSFGTRDCKTPGYPSVYTRVAYYTDWILDHLKE
ncbi:transmembrane protease serine 9 [Diachasma alloeum]|uniref:transmembrane protease serine 9 n=1 Tax=Diachasma alloeum TaxID=454923 RepID=UPI0010FB31A9|nr:transmembrane protease serine 9 [Diachasma alloeum]